MICVTILILSINMLSHITLDLATKEKLTQNFAPPNTRIEGQTHAEEREEKRTDLRILERDRSSILFVHTAMVVATVGGKAFSGALTLEIFMNKGSGHCSLTHGGSDSFHGT